MTKAEIKFEELKNTPSDCNKHFDTIRKYVSEGDLVVELGVRKVVSTWALIVNKPKELVSVDIVTPPEENLKEIVEAAKEQGTVFSFYQQDSTFIDLGTPVDVLFVDTLHLYSHLVKELWRHSHNVRKYIIFHDYGIPEVSACIHDFLYNTEWEWAEINKEGTGLCVLHRRDV